ncbi:hypothetical protein F4678DRAFT_453609 [Xylaria arbuscula]|nr:hypothetical protein F4678DRAFT_453609 [Xylaria arbuscula]
MDGPSSRFPSTSVSSTTHHELGMSILSAPRQSLKELWPSLTSSSTAGIDPPRPAKEGYEWVWFPGGYWAEREIVEAPRKDSTRPFGWRKRSGKSGSGSQTHSSHTPTPLPERTEAWSEHSPGGRLLSRTAASSESGGSFFPLSRMPDAPLPSPYLTEEAHVQSLQWPSLDATARGSSTSGSSIFKPRVILSPSPLQLLDELEYDRVSPSTIKGQQATATSSDTGSTQVVTQNAAAVQEAKPSMSFIQWRMLSDQRQRMRRSRTSSEENMGADATHVQLPRAQATISSPLRKTSNISDKSRKSLKGFSTKLLRKARWPRKISSSSAASTSSSRQSVYSHSSTTPGSERGETTVVTNAWTSEYPGGEAVRVQIPHTEQFPRSFFADLSPPVTPRRSLSRQEGQANLKKTNLSTSFTPGDSSTSSAATPPVNSATREEYHHLNSDSNSDTRARKPGHNEIRPSPRRPKKDNSCKEWWEVSVPATYAAVDQRTFKFDMPEHLPTSPMCPTNKRHKSGGTGVCVYHGRAKTQSRRPATSGGESPKSRTGGGEDGENGNGNEDDEDSGERSDVWK